MKYQIMRYDPDRLVAVVKVASTSSRILNGPEVPISIENIQSTSDFEKAVYIAYAATISPRLKSNFSQELEGFITTATGQVLDFSIPIVPIGTAQSSGSDAPTDTASTATVQVL